MIQSFDFESSCVFCPSVPFPFCNHLFNCFMLKWNRSHSNHYVQHSLLLFQILEHNGRIFHNHDSLGESIKRWGVDLASNINMNWSSVSWRSGHHWDTITHPSLSLDVDHWSWWWWWDCAGVHDDMLLSVDWRETGHWLEHTADSTLENTGEQWRVSPGAGHTLPSASWTPLQSCSRSSHWNAALLLLLTNTCSHQDFPGHLVFNTSFPLTPLVFISLVILCTFPPPIVLMTL